MATKSKVSPPKTPQPEAVKSFEIVGNTKKIQIAIMAVGILQAGGTRSQVLGGQGNYLVKLGQTFTQPEVDPLLKKLKKTHPSIKWWANEKEL